MPVQELWEPKHETQIKGVLPGNLFEQVKCQRSDKSILTNTRLLVNSLSESQNYCVKCF